MRIKIFKSSIISKFSKNSHEACSLSLICTNVLKINYSLSIPFIFYGIVRDNWIHTFKYVQKDNIKYVNQIHWIKADSPLMSYIIISPEKKSEFPALWAYLFTFPNYLPYCRCSLKWEKLWNILFWRYNDKTFYRESVFTLLLHL